MLEGPTAIAFIEADGDMVGVAKALSDSAQTTKILAIRGGILDGNPIGEDDVQNLATLPPIDVLRGQVLGAITAPLMTVVGLISRAGARPDRPDRRPHRAAAGSRATRPGPRPVAGGGTAEAELRRGAEPSDRRARRRGSRAPKSQSPKNRPTRSRRQTRLRPSSRVREEE